MNSLERVLAALDHREPARVPIDLGASDTFVAREVYEGLARLLGLEPTVSADVAHPGAFVTPDETMLTSLGADVLNPTQTSAAGMDPFALKRDFGRDIAFWGGIDVIELLPRGTAAEVEREVKRHLDALAPDGGYVLAPSHIIQRFTPPENVLTMVRVALEYGAY